MSRARRRPEPKTKLESFEHRYIRFGIQALTIVGFTAFVVHELWRILGPFLGPWWNGVR